MNSNTVEIKLISTTLTKDIYGVGQPSETERTAYAFMNNVSGKEWFEGGRIGVNPDMRFTMFAPEYNNEEIIEYNGARYGVYRTYTDGDWIDLYVEKRNRKEASNG